jgi:hypothetical protein
MKNQNCFISPMKRKNLEAQGFTGYSDEELAARSFGFRFSTGLCALLIGTGVLLANIPLLLLAAATALLGAILPRHPFDYLYNATFAGTHGKARLDPNTPQRKFACAIATLWLGGVIGLFYAQLFMWAYIFGAILTAVAVLVTTTDFCIPSAIYNFLFMRGKSVS